VDEGSSHSGSSVPVAAEAVAASGYVGASDLSGGWRGGVRVNGHAFQECLRKWKGERNNTAEHLEGGTLNI